MTKLTGLQIADAGLDGWVYLLGGLQTRIHTRNFATGLSVVNAIGAAAEEMTHHPDLSLRYTHVDARLTSHDEHGVTDRDIRLARTKHGAAAYGPLQQIGGRHNRATFYNHLTSPAMNRLRRSGQLASLPLARRLSVVSAERRGEGVRRGVAGPAGDLGEGQLAGPQVVAGERHPPVC
jgi:pterin-4a-carbinolamine dehydratase